MRIFEHPSENFICPICGTNEDKPVTLIPIAGKNNGLTYEARQYHMDCIQVFEYVGPAGEPTLLCMEFVNKAEE